MPTTAFHQVVSSLRGFPSTVTAQCSTYTQIQEHIRTGEGEPGIAGCSCQSDIYPGECGLARTSLSIDRRSVI